jgi:hypothetical protein
MEQSPLWKAKSLSLSRIPHLLWNLKAHYRVHRSLPIPRPRVTFPNKLFSRWGVVSPRPTPKLEGYPCLPRTRLLHPQPEDAPCLGKKLVKLSLCLTKHHPMKTYSGSGGIAPRILTSALDGGEWSASRPGRFTPRGITARTHWVWGWVGPRAGMDMVSKTEIPSPRRESKPDHPIVQPVANRYTDWAIPAPPHAVVLFFSSERFQTR